MRHVGVISLLVCAGCFSPVLDFPDGGRGGGSASGGGASSGGGGTGTGGNGGNGGSGIGGSGIGGSGIGGSGIGGSGIGGSGAGGSGGGAAGGVGGGGDCSNDSDCEHGMVCDPCGDALWCAPGCRTDPDCGGNGMTCQGGVDCFTCPCALHFCGIDPCIDLDHDGFTTGGSCNSKPGGDCDDTNPAVHPGALEICDDGIDNDCNGLIDGQDPACQSQLCNGAAMCQNNFDCDVGSTFCEHDPAGVHGCCDACPPPGGVCMAGETTAFGGTDPLTGCPQTLCIPDGVCPQNIAPVCSTTGATYSNLCEAQLAGAQIAHQGECVTGEGVYCNPQDPSTCGVNGGLYCRDACPICDQFDFVCTKVGACVFDVDCPAGEAPPPGPACMNGQMWTASCVQNACVYACK